MSVLDVLASADKLRTSPLDCPLGLKIFVGLFCKSLVNFSWLRLLLVEKPNVKSLLVTVQQCQNPKSTDFSIQNVVVLRHDLVETTRLKKKPSPSYDWRRDRRTLKF
jgi:hypothetical protein